jgi:hypothetical protein
VTGLQIAAADIDQHLPAVLQGSAIVALVPATANRAWAAHVAWDIARAAALAGRRTALVDCFVDEPSLHQVAGTQNAEGIVDAFEYGASLNRIVQEQPEANLFFIPAGTFAPDAEPLVTHPRWRRLSAGFRYEEALLLLYVAAEHVAGLAAEPDGMIVIAPEGLELAVAQAPAVAEAVGRGAPLLAVVAARAAPREAGVAAEAAVEGAVHEEAAPEPEPARPSGARRSSQPMAMLVEAHRGPPASVAAVAAVLVVALVVVGYLFRADLLSLAGLQRGAAAEAARAAPRPQVDTLAWVVQVSAWSQLGEAYVDADSLEQSGVPSLVVPIELPRLGRRYRVHAGPFADSAAADSVLGRLRRGGWLRVGEGAVSALPLSFELPGELTPNGAMEERARLRAAGVPTFVLGQADGTYRLYAGAYESAAQAAALQDVLLITGSVGELRPRVGFVP